MKTLSKRRARHGLRFGLIALVILIEWGGALFFNRPYGT